MAVQAARKEVLSSHVVELDVEVGAGVVTNPDDESDHPAVSIKITDSCLGVRFYAEGARELAAELIEKAKRAEELVAEDAELEKEELS